MPFEGHLPDVAERDAPLFEIPDAPKTVEELKVAVRAAAERTGHVTLESDPQDKRYIETFAVDELLVLIDAEVAFLDAWDRWIKQNSGKDANDYPEKDEEPLPLGADTNPALKRLRAAIIAAHTHTSMVGQSASATGQGEERALPLAA